MQLVELERRCGRDNKVEDLYAQTFSIFKDNRIKSFVAIKYARFLFKVSFFFCFNKWLLIVIRNIIKQVKYTSQNFKC